MSRRWTHKRSVKRRYDLTAEMYDKRYADEQEAKYKAALNRMTVSGLVLDVGCGTGLLFRYAVAEAESVVGADVSKKLLLKARERAKEMQNVHLVQADADHLPFQNGCFTVVFVFTVLQNMPKPEETVKEMGRIAMQDAFVVVTGLKKVFSVEAFERLVHQSHLGLVSVNDDSGLTCYVAICSKSSG